MELISPKSIPLIDKYCITALGIPEYELTLSVSLALRDELLRRGYTVVMVRETHDVKITNME